MQLNIASLKQFLDYSLSEDLGVAGDITSNIIINNDKYINFFIIAKQNGVICGNKIAEYFLQNYSNAKYQFIVQDACFVNANTVILEGACNARDILYLERTILNYLQHLSGIATLTKEYVDRTAGRKVKICDTRKTIPGIRSLQKYAVTCGGGSNHRLTLDNAILIKDNHIAICGNLIDAITKTKLLAPHYMKITVECDRLDQVDDALHAGADIIMLDNMNLTDIAHAVQIINGKTMIEVSGGVSLENISAIADLGVDIISVGKLTHSVSAMDISMDIS